MNQNNLPTNAVRWSTLYGTLYYFLGKAFVDAFGTEGEDALRKAVRDYGHYRARFNRERHEALDLPINLMTMSSFGDMPNDSLSSEGRVVEANFSKSTVTGCTLFRTWKSFGDNQIGRIYCDEVHFPLFCGYDADISLEMPAYFTKGDDHCFFRMKFPSADKTPLPDNAREKVPRRSLESSMARLTAIMYVYLAQAMIKRFGERGRNEVKKALEAFAAHRAAKLRSEHETAGFELSLTTLLKKGDVSYGDSLEIQCDQKSSNRSVITIVKSAFDDALKEIEGRQTPIGHLYYQTVPGGLISGYLQTVDVTLRACSAVNDIQTVLDVKWYARNNDGASDSQRI